MATDGARAVTSPSLRPSVVITNSSPFLSASPRDTGKKRRRLLHRCRRAHAKLPGPGSAAAIGHRNRMARVRDEDRSPLPSLDQRQLPGRIRSDASCVKHRASSHEPTLIGISSRPSIHCSTVDALICSDCANVEGDHRIFFRHSSILLACMIRPLLGALGIQPMPGTRFTMLVRHEIDRWLHATGSAVSMEHSLDRDIPLRYRLAGVRLELK